MALSHCLSLVQVFALLEAKAQRKGNQENPASSEEALGAEERASDDSSNFKEVAATAEGKDESAPEEPESSSSDGGEGKEEGLQNSKPEPDNSEDDGLCQNSESDGRSSCDSSSTNQTIVSGKDVEQNSKSEPEDSEANGLRENSPRGVLEKPISSPDSDRRSSSDTTMMHQSILPGKEDDHHKKPEPDNNIVNDSTQNSPRGAIKNALPFAYSDGSSSADTSSADQKLDPYGTSVESHKWLRRSLISRLITRKKMSTFFVATRSSSLPRPLERIKNNKDQIDIGRVAKDVGTTGLSWRNFDYEELAAATDGFSQESLIGKGGHAEVYKGRLIDGQLVAVKKLTKGDEEARIADFLSELGIIAHVNHPNAAQLVGFSVERCLLLVLRFSAHGSLASVLHGSKERLEWNPRFKIAIGVSEGLLYLHEGCQRRIIHRDIKASNILLNEGFQPQISDFGLAKWLPDKWNHHIVFPIEGTFGYMAPEYFMHGVMNEKTDVFAFGVLLLELITGRLAVDFSRQSLVIWAKPLFEANKVSELVDPALGDAYDLKEVTRALQVASMCIHNLSTSRPSMKEVVRLLRNEDGSIDLIEQASSSRSSRSPLIDAPGMEEYTCSRYLNDLHRYKQLALEHVYHS